MVLGRAEDRTHRDAEARRPTRRRRRANLGDRLADGRDRLAPERAHVAVPRAGGERRAGGAADADRNRRALPRLAPAERAPPPRSLPAHLERALRPPRAPPSLP